MTIESQISVGGGCSLAGPGRGDCEHFIGLPAVMDETTTDVYGKPHGWCWLCWRGYRLERAETALQILQRESDTAVSVLQDKLRVAEADAARLRELLTCYNLGGWTDAERLMRERNATSMESHDFVYATLEQYEMEKNEKPNF